MSKNARVSQTVDFAEHILVETEEMIAWNKPPALATTGRDLDDPDCAQHLAIDYVGDMVWALHQLDRDTSGVVLFSKKKSLVARWQTRWNTEAVTKYYAALVHGRLTDSPMQIEAPLRRHSRRGYTEVTVDEAGKEALTEVWAVDESDHYSLVVARAVTGRTHQIRVHLQHIGCPLVGEERYNSIPCGYHWRHALHAWMIVTDAPAPFDVIVAPVADDLEQPARRLKLDLNTLVSERQRLIAG